MKALALLASLAILAAAQSDAPKKDPPKPFTPPPVRFDYGFVFGGPLAKDEGCAKDLVRAEQMDGIERRKFLAEVISLGCAKMLSGVYIARALESKTFNISEGNTVTFRRVLLTMIRNLTQEAYAYKADYTLTLEGWIVGSSMIAEKLTDAQLLERATKVRQSWQNR